MITTTAIVLIIVFYYLGAVLAYHIIEDNLIALIPQYTVDEMSTTLTTYVYRNRKMIATYCSLIFPIYLGFYLGYQMGKKVYNILTDNKYENRIIAWLF